jgi:hypothetical protein
VTTIEHREPLAIVVCDIEQMLIFERHVLDHRL